MHFLFLLVYTLQGWRARAIVNVLRGGRSCDDAEGASELFPCTQSDCFVIKNDDLFLFLFFLLFHGGTQLHGILIWRRNRHQALLCRCCCCRVSDCLLYAQFISHKASLPVMVVNTFFLAVMLSICSFGYCAKGVNQRVQCVKCFKFFS